MKVGTVGEHHNAWREDHNAGNDRTALMLIDITT